MFREHYREFNPPCGQFILTFLFLVSERRSIILLQQHHASLSVAQLTLFLGDNDVTLCPSKKVHSKKVSSLNFIWGLCAHGGVPPVYSGLQPQSTNMHVRLIGDTKLTVGVSVSIMIVCLVCFCVV